MSDGSSRWCSFPPASLASSRRGSAPRGSRADLCCSSSLPPHPTVGRERWRSRDERVIDQVMPAPHDRGGPPLIRWTR